MELADIKRFNSCLAKLTLLKLVIKWCWSTYSLFSVVFQCKKLDPSTLKLCIEGMQPQLSKLFDSCASDLRGASAELKSSDPRSEA
jgi:hypothetical protein